MSGLFWQNVIVFAIVAGAVVWLLRRVVGPRKPEGSCANCPAHPGARAKLANAARRAASGRRAPERLTEPESRSEPA
jgi:hypothetical protein